jgi:hypothetical protein
LDEQNRRGQISELISSSGYSIEIKEISENSENITVTIENVLPGEAVLAVITQLYHIVKIPRSSKQIKFIMK